MKKRQLIKWSMKKMIESNRVVKGAMIKRACFYLTILFLAVSIFGVSRRQVAVISTQCVGCTDCTKVCVKDAVEIIRGKAVIDSDKCNGCGLCISICSYNAIRYKGER